MTTTKSTPSPRFSVEPGSEPGLAKFVIELSTVSPIPAHISPQTEAETICALTSFFAINTMHVLTALKHAQLGKVVHDIMCGSDVDVSITQSFPNEEAVSLRN